MQVLKIGKISSVNPAKGTARVTFEDRDGFTSPEFPFIAWEFWMPEVADQVLVGHLKDGASAVILGPVWSNAHRPREGRAGIFRKELDHTPGRAAVEYDEKTGQLLIRADRISVEVKGGGGQTVKKDLLSIFQEIEALLQAARE